MNQAPEDRPELQEKLSELEILRQSLEESKMKEKECRDQLLRVSAEFQNYRKRAENRMAEARRQGGEDVLLHVVALSDALAQADSSSRKATDVEMLKEGLSLMRQQFEKFLKEAGLLPIPSIGEKLDPHRHEAIAQVERDDIEEGIITDEIQRGYTLDGRVVRPSRVTVSVKPKT